MPGIAAFRNELFARFGDAVASGSMPRERAVPTGGCELQVQSVCGGTAAEYRIRLRGRRGTWEGNACGCCARSYDDLGELLSAVRLLGAVR